MKRDNMDNNLQDITKSGALSYRELQQLNNERAMLQNSIDRTVIGANNAIDDLDDNQKAELLNRYYKSVGVHDNLDPYEGDLAADYYNAGYGQSKYDKGITDVSELVNLEEHRAEQQSYLAQLGMGALKMGTLAVTTFLDNFIGTLYGTVNVINETAQGNVHSFGEALDAFIRNPFSMLMQDINAKSEEWFPNYYTQEEKETPWYNQWWHANFIGDHFLKNTGFMIGAAASAKVSAGALSKVMGLEKARDVFRGTTLAAGAPEGTTAKEVLQAYKSGKSIAGVEEITESLAQSAKQLKHAETRLKLASVISGSFGESRMEAITNSNDYVDNKGRMLLEQQRAEAIENILPDIQHNNPDLFMLSAIRNEEGKIVGYKTVPKDPAAVEKIYNQRFAEIEDTYNRGMAELTKEQIDYSNTSFLVNLLLTSAENMQLFGDAITGGYTMNRAMRDLVTKKGAKYEVARGLAAKKVARGAASPIFEGTQEMFQQATAVGLDRWEAKKFNEFYGKGLNPDGLEATTNWLSTMAGALGDVYADSEQWENFAMGFFTALLPIPGKGPSTVTTDKDGNKQLTKGKIRASGEFWDSIREARQIKKDATAQAQALNDIIENPEKRAMLLAMTRHMDADEKSAKAVEEGDKKAFKDAEFEKFINAAIAFSEAGRAQDFLDLVEAAYTVEEKDIEGIKALTMFKDGKTSLFDGMKDSEIIDYFKQKKDKVMKLAEKIQQAESDITTLYGDSQSKEFKQELLYDIMAVDNREQRIKEISDKLLGYVNARKQFLKDKFGYDLGEDLQTIQDLSVFFGSEEEVDEMNKLIETSKKALDKKLAERSKKRQQLSGRVLGLSNTITKLEAKVADGTITEEEKKRLSQLKRRVNRAKTDISRIAETLKNIKQDIEDEKKQYNPDMIAMSSELQDLLKLLVNREYLLHRLNALTTNPDSFEDGLTKQLYSAINSFIDRKLERVYRDFERTRDLSILQKSRISFERLKAKIDAGSNEKLKGYMSAVEKYSSIFEAEGSQFSLEDPATITLYNEVLNSIKSANSVEEADKRVNELIDILDSTGGLGEGTSKLTRTLKKAMAIDTKVKEALDEDGVSAKKDAKKKKEESISKDFLKIKDIDSEIEDLDKDELLDFIDKYGLTGKVEEFYSEYVDEGENVFDAVDADDLRNAIKTLYEEAGTTLEEEAEEEEEEPEESEESKEESSEDEEELKSEKKKKEKKLSKDGGSSESVKDEILPEASFTTGKRTKSKSTVKAEEGGPIYIKNSEEFKEGNAESNNSLTNGPIKEEQAIAVNRWGAKYAYDDLKNTRKRKATKSDAVWARTILENAGVQEFLDSGQLAILQQEATERGERLKVRFVQIRGNEGRGVKFSSLKQARIDKGRTIFVAVELPKGTAAEAPHAWDYHGVDGKTKRMQLLGIASPGKGASEASKNRFERLKNAVQEETKAAKTKDGDMQSYAYSSITTDLEWIFTGRIVKSTDDIELGERDLYSIFSDKEKAAQKKGKDQLQIVVKRSDFPEDDFVIGEDLGGEVIELNQNRPATGGRGVGLRSKSDRVGTVWIRTKEADGKVYYKGVKIRNFDEEYTADNSPIAKKIRQAIKNMVESKDAKWQDAAIELQKYLYVPSGKKFYIDAKNRVFRIGSESVDFDSEDAVQEIYDLIKSQGYRFSIGYAKLSVSDILESQILYTDLAMLHNVNSSFLISEVDVEFDTDGKSVKSVDIRHSPVVTQMIAAERIHTGQLGIQEGRDRTWIIKLSGDDNDYAIYSDGTYWIMSGEHQQEEVTDPHQKFLIEFKLLIDLGNRLEPEGYIKRKAGTKGKSVQIYKLLDPSGREIYMTSEGKVLTLEDRKNLTIVKKKGKGNEAALEKLRKSLLPTEENPSKKPQVSITIQNASDEELEDIVDGKVDDGKIDAEIQEYKVGDAYDFRDPESLDIVSTDTITDINEDEDKIYFSSEDGSTTVLSYSKFQLDALRMQYRLQAKTELERRERENKKKEGSKPEEKPKGKPAAPVTSKKIIIPGKGTAPAKPTTSSEKMTEDFFNAVLKTPTTKTRLIETAKKHGIKTLKEFKEGFVEALDKNLSAPLKERLKKLMTSTNPEDIEKALGIVEENIDCFGIAPF